MLLGSCRALFFIGRDSPWFTLTKIQSSLNQSIFTYMCNGACTLQPHAQPPLQQNPGSFKVQQLLIRDSNHQSQRSNWSKLFSFSKICFSPKVPVQYRSFSLLPEETSCSAAKSPTEKARYQPCKKLLGSRPRWQAVSQESPTLQTSIHSKWTSGQITSLQYYKDVPKHREQ